MSDKKKSVIEEATLEYEKIQQAMNANTKEVLRSLMAEEIENFVKETITEADFEEEEIEDDSAATEAGEEETEEMPEIEASEEETEEMPEISTDIEMDSEEETEEMPEISTDIEMGTEVEPEITSDFEMSPSIDTINMMDASDDDVISVYKKLSGEDEIEVVSDNEVVITDPKSGSEYTVEINGEKEEGIESVMDTEIEPEIEGSEEEMPTEEGVVYEVSMDEETIADTEGSEEVSETNRTLGGGDETKGGLPKQKGSKSPAMKESVSIEKYNAIVKENEEFKKILADFKNKLVETVVFNSNLTYVTKLFMEHSTTQPEKQNILKRFDNDVHSLNESQKLYKTIKNELATKSNISESVDSKLNKIVTNGSSKLNESTITESKGYADESTKRIIDLFKRVENK
jgi:ribosomal protein S6E (S10)